MTLKILNYHSLTASEMTNSLQVRFSGKYFKVFGLLMSVLVTGCIEANLTKGSFIILMLVLCRFFKY